MFRHLSSRQPVVLWGVRLQRPTFDDAFSAWILVALCAAMSLAIHSVTQGRPEFVFGGVLAGVFGGIAFALGARPGSGHDKAGFRLMLTMGYLGFALGTGAAHLLLPAAS